MLRSSTRALPIFRLPQTRMHSNSKPEYFFDDIVYVLIIFVREQEFGLDIHARFQTIVLNLFVKVFFCFGFSFLTHCFSTFFNFSILVCIRVGGSQVLNTLILCIWQMDLMAFHLTRRQGWLYRWCFRIFF